MSEWLKEHKIGLAQVVVGIVTLIAMVGLGIGGYFVTVYQKEIREWVWGQEIPTPVESPSPESSLVAVPLDSVPNPSPTPKTESVKSPVPSASAAPSERPPIQEPTKSGGTQRTRTLDNDVGKSKANDFYEITVENAWASRDRVSFGICNFNVPSEQKAILVRFTIRLLTPPRTYEESQRLAHPHTTDFVLVDDQNRRLDPRCQGNGTGDIYLNSYLNSNSGNATTLTLAYLVPAGSEHASFRFQKSGAGRPIAFDLSGLN